MRAHELYVESIEIDQNSNRFLVRRINKKAVENVEILTQHLNSFTSLDFFLVPAEITEDPSHYSVKFVFVESKKANLKEPGRVDGLVQKLLRYARACSVSLCPPLTYFFGSDVLSLGTDSLLIPPLPLKPEWYERLGEDHEELFLVADELSYTGTLRLIGRVISLLFPDEYLDLREKLLEGRCERADIDAYLLSQEEEDELQSLTTQLERIVQGTLQDALRASGFRTVQLARSSLRVQDLVFEELYAKLRGEYALLNVKNDVTNVLRQFVTLYREYLSEELRLSFSKCLGEPCKFDVVLLDIVNALLSLSRGLIVFVDDLKKCDYLVRAFVERLKFLARGGFSVLLVSSSVEDPDFVVIPEHGVKSRLGADTLEALRDQGLKNTFVKALALVGGSGLVTELDTLVRHHSKEGTDGLRYLVENRLIEVRGAEYRLNEEFAGIIASSLDEATKRLLLKDLSSAFLKGDEYYGFWTLRSASFLGKAGEYVGAACLYVRFIRRALSKYTVSPTRLREAFERLYEVLKILGRTDSYCLLRLWLQYRYQTLENILPELNTNFNSPDPLLKCLYHHVNQNYEECLKLRLHSKDEKLTFFKRAHLTYLVALSEYYLTDKLSEESELELLEILHHLPSGGGFDLLKVEINLLLGSVHLYYDRRKAMTFLRRAERLIESSGAVHAKVRLLNLYGNLHDSELISTIFYNDAIEVAKRIGYSKRIHEPLINYLRAVLYFGMLGTFRKIAEKAIKIIPDDEEIAPSQRAFFLRIVGFLHTYQHEYEAGLALYSRALEIERRHGLQRSALRAMVIHELLCGHLDRARTLIVENIGDPALRTRGMEYIVEMTLSDDEETFKRAWEKYKHSKVYLLREETLYVFANKLIEVDEEGFLEELNRWEMVYSLERTKLSLFYVLLARNKYYQAKANELKAHLTKARIMRLAQDMKISHPFLLQAASQTSEAMNETREFSVLTGFLHVLHSVDSKLSLEQFVKLFANLILEYFGADEVNVRVTDAATGLEFEYGTPVTVQATNPFVEIRPIRVYLSGNVDDRSGYALYFSSETAVLGRSHEEFESIVTTVEEIFVENVAAILQRERASRDPLTGLFNRWKINDILSDCMKEYRISDRVFSVVLIDIDNFKGINDRYGHRKGDQVLKWFAEVLEAELGVRGTVGRFGGEEFIGVLFEKKEQACAMCENLRVKVEAESIGVLGLRVTISVGVATAHERGTLPELIGLADQRLYRAKELGRNRVVVD